jgi:hypothetical protein
MAQISSRLRSIYRAVVQRYNTDFEFAHSMSLRRLGSQTHSPDLIESLNRLELAEIDASDAIEEQVIPLNDPLYKDSGLLQTVRLLLMEIKCRAQIPAFETHVASNTPSNESKDETCAICMEEFEDDISSNDWRNSHSPVITSCGHMFGGVCLSVWLANVKSRSCPYCRKDFNEVPDDCDLMWGTWEDIWRWFVDRKHTMATCGHQVSGRYLWDNCDLNEIKARFGMQKIFPIPPEY